MTIRDVTHLNMFKDLSISKTAGYGNVRLSSRGGVEFTPWPRHTKDVKIVPTATLFGVEHIRIRVGSVITFSR